MLLKTLIIFSLLLVALFVGIYLHNEHGYVVVILKNYTIETNIWVIILGVLLIGISLYIMFSILNKVFNFPKDLTNWKKLINLHNAKEKTRQGLIEFNEGRWQLAKKHLIDALPNAETPLLNYLTAARAAQEMGDNTQRDDFLRQAQQSMPEAKIAVELTQAQLQIANKQWEQALATLKHLQSLSPKHAYVLKLLCELYEEIKDWPQLIKLLPTIKRYKLIPNQEFLKKQKNAYLQELKFLIKQDSANTVDDFMQNLPKELKYESPINCAYTAYLIAVSKDKQAAELLHKLLAKENDISLLLNYIKLNPEFMDLKFVESLAINNAIHIFKYCLGKISIAKKLWGKAQVYFQESINANPTMEAYQELGMLFEKANRANEALEAYRNGLHAISYKAQID